MGDETETSASTETLQARVAELESALAASNSKLEVVNSDLVTARGERDKLREAWQAVKFELELMKKRLFVAKAERVDVAQLELEFAKKLAELDALSKRLEPVPPWMMATVAGAAGGGAKAPPKKTGGRRNVRELELPEERIELLDAELEGRPLVKRLGFEDSFKLGWRKGGFVRVVVARAKYQVENSQAAQEQGAPPTAVVTAQCQRKPFLGCWLPRRCWLTSSSRRDATGCRCTGCRRVSFETARSWTAAPCPGGWRTSATRWARRWWRPRGSTSWPPPSAFSPTPPASWSSR